MVAPIKMDTKTMGYINVTYKWNFLSIDRYKKKPYLQS